VDNINRMMLQQGGQDVGDGATNHIYQVAMPQQPTTFQQFTATSQTASPTLAGMSPQLSHLTNTLKKKKNCLGGHPGPCHHRGSNGGTTDSSVRSDSAAGGDVETETEMLPPSEVVFRAVSPHGHVYWEIDPKRPLNGLHGVSKLTDVRGHHQQVQLQQQSSGNSDTDTNNDMHNLSDFSEEDGSKILLSDRSRQSSSRFSDNRPLLPATSHQQHLVNSLATLPENSNLVNLIQFSPQRFNSLQQKPSLSQEQLNQINAAGGGFSTRTRLRRPQQQPHRSQDVLSTATSSITTASVSSVTSSNSDGQNTRLPAEHLQQQVQIPDLRRIPVSVKSSEYIMAKIQSHIDQKQQSRKNGASTPSSSHSEREV
jgi:hypothetical protein